MIAEGSRCSYTGPELLGARVGDLVRVVASSGDASHVRWESGDRAGEIDLVLNDNLVVGRSGHTGAASVAAQMADSLDFGPMAVTGLREAYDEGGVEGAVAVLDDSGHLAMLAEAAEAVLAEMSARVRSHPRIVEALEGMDPDDAAKVSEAVAAIVLADTARGEAER